MFATISPFTKWILCKINSFIKIESQKNNSWKSVKNSFFFPALYKMYHLELFCSQKYIKR